MDFSTYLLGLLLTFGFGILTYQDRTYGIFGIITGAVFASFYAYDGSIIVDGTTYTPALAGGTWQLLGVTLIIMILLDFLIYNHITSIQKRSTVDTKSD